LIITASTKKQRAGVGRAARMCPQARAGNVLVGVVGLGTEPPRSFYEKELKPFSGLLLLWAGAHMISCL